MKKKEPTVNKYECKLAYMCPAIKHCRKNGQFTRLNTSECNCRDLINQGFKINE